MAHIELSVHSQLLGQVVDISVVTPRPPTSSSPWPDPSPAAQPQPRPLPAASRQAGDALVPYPAARRPRFRAPRACFLLHGTAGNHSSWPNHTDLEALATRYNLAFICPTTGRSFGLNWRHGLPWGDFVADELPLLAAEHLRLDTGRNRALIAGFSAGGYAAFYAALTRPGQFGAAGAFSGVLDMAGADNRTRRAELYDGAFATDSIADTDADLLALLTAGTGADLPTTPLWAACGHQDHLYPQNLTFVEHADAAGWPIEWQHWDGVHDWAFWAAALPRFLDWVERD